MVKNYVRKCIDVIVFAIGVIVGFVTTKMKG